MLHFMFCRKIKYIKKKKKMKKTCVLKNIVLFLSVRKHTLAKYIQIR